MAEALQSLESAQCCCCGNYVLALMCKLTCTSASSPTAMAPHFSLALIVVNKTYIGDRI